MLLVNVKGVIHKFGSYYRRGSWVSVACNDSSWHTWASLNMNVTTYNGNSDEIDCNECKNLIKSTNKF